MSQLKSWQAVGLVWLVLSLAAVGASAFSSRTASSCSDATCAPGCGDCMEPDAQGRCVAVEDGAMVGQCQGACAPQLGSGARMCCAGACVCAGQRGCRPSVGEAVQ